MVVDRRRIYSKRDRLRQLRGFCHAARLGSITQAAQHLGLSQPAVSLHVHDLEDELQAVLFDRGSFGISLTEAGERLYALAEPLLEGMEGVFAHFAERIKEDLTGRVEIAASVAGAALVLPPSIKRLRDRYPGVRVRVRNHTLGEGMALLRAGEVEFVLGAREPLLEDMSVEYREMLCYDIVLITSLDHALAGRETVTPQEAAQWPSVMPPAGSYSRQFGEAAARQFGVEVRAVIEVSGWAVIKRYVERGLGISVVPSICVKEETEDSGVGDSVRGLLSGTELRGLHPAEQGSDGARAASARNGGADDSGVCAIRRERAAVAHRGDDRGEKRRTSIHCGALG